jgi:hypothetical protein
VAGVKLDIRSGPTVKLETWTWDGKVTMHHRGLQYCWVGPAAVAPIARQLVRSHLQRPYDRFKMLPRSAGLILCTEAVNVRLVR